MTAPFPSSSLSDARKWFREHVINDSDMSSHIEHITPVRAYVLLEHNPTNRNIREAKVAQYVHDMKEGNWKTNGESVIISKEGELNDGQHRLTAIMRSGIAQMINLVTGANREDRNTIDLGAAKSAGDHMAMAGVSNANVVAACVRGIISYEQSGAVNNANRVSSPAIQKRAREDELAMEAGVWAGNSAHKLSAIRLRGGLAGTLFYLLASVEPKCAKEFMIQLRDGAHLAPESPIYILRQKLAIGAKLTPNQKLEACVRGWNAWVRDEAFSRVTIMGRIPEIKGLKKNGKSSSAETAPIEG